MQNHFELLDIPQAFEIDLNLLENNYRKLQAQVHPDKFVTASPAERLQSMQTATAANEAFQTLKQPTARASYLLSLQGIATDEERNTAMPADFLMAQMEWREAIEEAKDANNIVALDDLLMQFRQEKKALNNAFSNTYLTDVDTAAATVRKLQFIDKISADVSNLIAELED